MKIRFTNLENNILDSKSRQFFKYKFVLIFEVFLSLMNKIKDKY